MNYLKALAFGVIEGITEWLPISSTAHMNILNIFLPLDVSVEFYDMFEVVIQLGAILALLLIYWKKIWPFGQSNNPLGEGILSYVKKDKFILLLKMAIACIPVIIYKLTLDDVVNFVNNDNEMIIIAIALIVIGILFVVTEAYVSKLAPTMNSTKQITFMAAIIIGLVQLIAAIFPGVSRSGITIIVSLLIGVSRVAATEFTFELSIPVMIGASLMEVLHFGFAFSFSEILILLLGCFSAFIVSLFMIRFMINYIKKNNFLIFGIYRILMGIVIILFII